MRLYMWTYISPDGYLDAWMKTTKRKATSYRADMKRENFTLGPLVTVDLPEPGTTKGKRRGKT